VAKLATLEQYYQYMDNRPEKFGPEEVKFQDNGSGEYPCCGCVHWFWNPITGSTVCEILRTPDEAIPANFTCMFHTQDYETFPKMEEPK
jgi:hypothetical protein